MDSTERKIDEAIEGILKPLVFKDLEILKMKEGEVLLQIPFTEDLLNYKGDLHGGMTYTLADICSGLTCISYGYKVTTLQGSINYLKHGNRGPLYARSRVLHKGRSTIVVNVDISDGTNTIIANGSFSMFVLEKF